MLALAFLLTMQVLAGTTAGVADTAAIVPGLQTLELTLDPAAPSWSGSLRTRLTVRRGTRRFALRLAGAEPARVEVALPSGNVPLAFGWHGRDTLLVETADALAPGPAGFSVSFTGAWAAAAPGLWRPDARRVVLERGAIRVVPAWPDGTPETPWRLVVHAPANCDVVSSLPRSTRSLQRDWGTWEFASAGPLDADSLRVEVRPLPPRPARKHGGAVRRPRRR